MADLPSCPDLDQFRQRAKDLLRAAKRGNPDALACLHAVSGQLILDSAQLAVARDQGFASWARLKAEIERRSILDRADVNRLEALLAEHPELAVEEMHSWCEHQLGASPLGYVAMLRYDTAQCAWRDVAGTAAMARVLLDAGALVDGDPDDLETPLMTAASYGDAEVAQVLIDAGADLNATAKDSAGGVPGGTALRHAAVFGMTAVVDVLLAAGATDLVQAAAAGDITGMLSTETPTGRPGRRPADRRSSLPPARDRPATRGRHLCRRSRPGWIDGLARGCVLRTSRQCQAPPRQRCRSEASRRPLRRNPSRLVPPPARRDRRWRGPLRSRAAPGDDHFGPAMTPGSPRSRLAILHRGQSGRQRPTSPLSFSVSPSADAIRTKLTAIVGTVTGTSDRPPSDRQDRPRRHCHAARPRTGRPPDRALADVEPARRRAAAIATAAGH